MIGVWNADIKTHYIHFHCIFFVRMTDSGDISLGLEAEPGLDLQIKEIHVQGNTLLATCTNPAGQSQALELTFHEDTITGSLSFPYFGAVAFTGGKGRGVSLAARLRKYGEKSVQENRLWKGKWIWDAIQPESNETAEHKLVYFRRTFELEESVKANLIVHITADSRYRLYLNGQSVSVGPCKGDRHTQYYESVDVSQFLVHGKNVLAVKVLRYPSLEPFKSGEGGPTSIWRSQSAGLFVDASLRDENDAELQSLQSDSQWVTYRHKGYRNVPKSFIRWMGGVEEVDGMGDSYGWEQVEFNDSEWNPAIVFAETRGFAGILSPWNLVPRPIPFLYEHERKFLKVTNVDGLELDEAGHLLQSASDSGKLIRIPAGKRITIELDAGELTTGYLRLAVRSGRNSIVKMMASECYEAHESNEMQRVKGNREDTSGKLLGEFDTYHVAGHAENTDQEEIYESFWFRTFRYIRLEIEAKEEPLELLSLTYRETGYPLDVKAHFESSDEQLNKIWELSVRTLKRCMHETYEDCPYYEQLQYAMDSRLMMLFTYYVSADDRMPRRTITDFYHSRLPSGLLQSRYPTTEPQIIPSFALYWVDMLAEHYEHNGDIDLIAAYRPAMLELLDWFHGQLTDEGIIGVTSNRYWTYFDWVDAWPLGAPPESMERPMYLLSLMYASALRKCSKLLSATGWTEMANSLTARADSVCLAVRNMAWSEEKKLFRDLPEMESYSQHMHVMAVLAEMVTGKEAYSLLERALDEDIHRVTLPFSYLLFQAMKKIGMHDKWFEQWDRWRVFASQGLTTLPETEHNPRSDCHAWSAVPLAEFPSTILGVTPAEPGFTTIAIEPRIGKLKWARGSVATAQGMVEVDWKLQDHHFELKVKVPDGVPAVIKLPDGTTKKLQGEGTFQCLHSEGR